ncbi:hypothetical protein KUDE01_030611, partial [Dissostichus eleginoides]
MNYSFSFMAFVDGGSGCRCKKIKTLLHEKQVSSPQQPSRREEESLNSLAQRCPIRSWSYNRSVNRGGCTYSSCTMLRKDRRNPGPPTGNWQSGGGCQWAAMVRQYTNSGGRGYRGCQ